MNKYIYILFFLTSVLSISQSRVGEWEMYLDYSSVNAIDSFEQKIYAGTSTQFFIYNKNDNSVSTFSKLNGLSDANISSIKYDNEFNVVIIGYANGNVDLFYPNRVINIPYIKEANIMGSKKINNIFIKDGVAYLACAFGLVELSIEEAEILDTYYFIDNGINSAVFNCFIFDDGINDDFLAGKIFVSTSSGVFSADFDNPNLINPNVWNSDFLVFQNNNLIGDLNSVFNDGFLDLLGDSNSEALFINPNGACSFVYYSPEKEGFVIKEIPQICNSSESNNIISLALFDNIFAGFSNNILFFVEDVTNVNGSIVDNLWISSWNYEKSFTKISIQKDNNIEIYFADNIRGVVNVEISSINNQFNNAPIIICPNGPADTGFGDMAFINDKLIISHGGKNGSWNNLSNNQEISIYQNHSFTHTNALVPEEINDAISVIPSPNNNSFFVGTWNFGLLGFEFTNNNFNTTSLISIYDEKNSSLQSITADGWIRIGGGCFDSNNVLWVTNSEANNPISSYNQNNWNNYSLNSIGNNVMSGKILCATNGQKWVQLRSDGLVVFEEEKGYITEKKISNSSSMGNLNDNTVNCLQEDHDGNIWIGTNNGINVFYFPENILTPNLINSEQILVESDGYVEPLLNNTTVLDIKIDGGNRKWLATEGKGVFLMSEDGGSQIHHFTKENSPLLDNTIYGISIDDDSGKVFFATALGLCSFRSGATKDRGGFQNVLIFPNPVKNNYDGAITISGLSDNTNVKITDVSGNLIFETVTEGGSATWNGKSFSGKRVQTGVYLFFCTNPLFNESVVKKVLIYN